jgi:hypothetical protein
LPFTICHFTTDHTHPYRPELAAAPPSEPSPAARPRWPTRLAGAIVRTPQTQEPLAMLIDTLIAVCLFAGLVAVLALPFLSRD